MGVTTEDCLQFIKLLVDCSRYNFADGGVLLSDQVYADGVRLLHAAGWTTEEEDFLDECTQPSAPKDKP
jgi:hypothetical protein